MSRYGTFLRMAALRYRSGSRGIRKRHKSTRRAGTIPIPKVKRQTARRWFSEKIQSRTSGTNAATTKPTSILRWESDQYELFRIGVNTTAHRRVCREDEEAVLPARGNTDVLGTLTGCNGS